MACEVRLTLADFLDATEVAVERIRVSAKRGHNHANVRSRSTLTRLHDDTLGACAELAVAKWLGIQWSRSVGTYHIEADVGEDVDVRCTDRDNGSLILRENDQPYRTFVLVTGNPPNMSLRGYIRGEDGMRPHWWRDPNSYGGAWFVPQDALISITPDGVVPPCLRQYPTAEVGAAGPASDERHSGAASIDVGAVV
jgi:hypothetical protein